MRADFSRQTSDQQRHPARHYAAVLHQQGRVWLESDWNEDALGRLHLLRQETRDVVGICGVPDPGSAFAISPNPDPQAEPDDFLIAGGAGPLGHYYVDGILCELDANASYLKQPDLPAPDRVTMPAADEEVTAVVYLEAWRRLVTYLEDEALREIALGGPDTAARLQTVAQVKVAVVPPGGVPDVNCATAHQFLPAAGRGTLTTLQPTDTLPADLCRLPDPANYTGRENRLYRVEVHDGGDVLGGPAGFAARVPLGADVAKGAVQLPLATALTADQARAFRRTGLALLADDDGRGEVLALADVAADGRTLTLALGLGAAYTQARNATVTGGVARFKWSRDNAAFAVAVTAVSPDRQKLTVASLGRDQATALRQGDLVEVSDDAHELGPGRGHLTYLTDHPDPDQFTISLADALPAAFGGGVTSPPVSPPTPAPTPTRHLTLRRWDGQGWAAAAFSEAATPDLNLGDGVHVEFGGADLRPGDYWQFAARSADGSVEALAAAPPMGTLRHRCPLAVVRWSRRLRLGKEEVLELFQREGILGEDGLRAVGEALTGGEALTAAEVTDLAGRAGATLERLKLLRALLDRREVEARRRTVFRIVADCRNKFPPLTKLTHLHYVSGDGQEGFPGRELPQPLQVGVANGSWPVPGARVRFQVVEGSGVLRWGVQAGTPIFVPAGPDGVAECRWQLDTQTASQRVEATLASGAALPVRFNASFRDDSEQPGVHVTEVSTPVRERPVPLLNDSDVLPSRLAAGIDVACDAPVDPGSVSRPTCFVTVEVPLPYPPQTIAPEFTLVTFAYQTLTLEAAVSAADKTITWRPTKQTVVLLNQLASVTRPNDRGVLTRLVLKGNFIWAKDNPQMFLDGEAFGFRRQRNSQTELQLPSGDGRRGGDFEMWFWLTRSVDLNALRVDPAIVLAGASATGTVVLDRPAPPGGVAVALASDNTKVAEVPLSALVPEGQRQEDFPVHTKAEPGQVQISATLGTTVKTAPLTTFLLVSFTLDPVVIDRPGLPVKGTLSLSEPAPSEVTVELTIEDPRKVVEAMPNAVPFKKGSKAETFTIRTRRDAFGEVNVRASLGGVTKPASFRVLG